jgi:lipopolysaccharide biosynthesis regulator YciM
MDFDLSWLLLGFPLIFGLGWMASRLDFRQWRIENRQAPKAYFKGLNFLLNEQQDQAIDAFIEAVQNDPDTSELHFTLGNLFRRRGEYERAVRVHEHLLSRADLSQADRDRAQHALALDFLKAGLLDRAEAALHKLEGTALEAQAQLALLAIFERSRDWPRAADMSTQLQASGQGNFSGRQSHYLCEQAAALGDAGHKAEARTLLERALITAPEAPRPRMELAWMMQQGGDAAGAYATLAALCVAAPQSIALVAMELARLGVATQQAGQTQRLLSEAYQDSASLDVLDALVWLQTEFADAPRHNWYLAHLEREPSLVAAAKWLVGEKLEHEQYHPLVQRALDRAVKPLTRYRCAACGFEAQQHFWQCPGCQAWDSYPPRRIEEL